MKSIVVTGDPVCNHNFHQGQRNAPDSHERLGFWEEWTAGGALMTHELIRRTLGDGADLRLAVDPDFKGLPAHSHAYCLWKPQVSNLQEKEKKHEVWRAAEPLLGYGRREGKPSSTEPPRPELLSSDILVIDDAGLDFRAAPPELGSPESIVLKLSASIGDGKLWDILYTTKPANLLVAMSADQLRQAEVRLSRALSWEATVQDLLHELEHNPALRRLKLARHLFVTFRCDGAFWLSRPPNEPPKSLLVFDGKRAEGEWVAATGQGVVFGYLSCLTAALVHQLSTETNPNFETALIAGLTAGRDLFRHGHGDVWKPDPAEPGKRIPNTDLGFPFDVIAAAIRRGPKNPEKLATTAIAASAPPREGWMMLDEWHVEAKQPRPYHAAAFAAAVLGPEALARFPVAGFGKLRTVDRQEIESLRLVREAMIQYRDGGPRKQPLNIGVFGPPGAGKSFGVQEIVRDVFHTDLLTFNLSQFTDAQMLNDAFNQIRDKVVAGETPVAFWDEFDSGSFRWMQYFLAPMNDGHFRDGPVTHPIGKCVFIFAGATSHDFESFGPPDPSKPGHPDHALLTEPSAREHSEAAWRDFVLKKGPDFKSRIVASLDVPGPNPRQKRCFDPKTGFEFEEDETDRCWPIRRAFFIRAHFDLAENQRLDIDHGLLRALLEIPRYQSGSRSLEFLCDYLRREAAGDTVRRSHMPGEPILRRHLNSEAFWEICERDSKFLEQAEFLARGFHEDWRKNPASQGNPRNVSWEELGPDYQRSNVQQALRIPQNLAVVGLRVEPGEFMHEQEAEARSLIRDNLEVLAEAEHNGWMVERMLAGWRYANIPGKDEDKKLHPLLLPYAQLPEHEKEKDRRPIGGFSPPPGSMEEPVDGYVDRLKRIGFRVVAKPGDNPRLPPS